MASRTGRFVLSTMKTPLAWKNLIHDYRRLTVAIGGIAFAVMLMFQQRGFQNALYDSTVEIIREMDADIILINSARFALTNERRFPRDLMDVAASVEGVESVEPVYLENLRARLRRAGNRALPIRVIAFDIDRPVFRDQRAEITPQLDRLRKKGTALMDRLSKRSFQFSLDRSAKFPQAGELNGRRIEMVGTFKSGRDFAHEGNLIMSTESFASYFPRRGPNPLSIVDLGLIKVNDQADLYHVSRQLELALNREVSVMTRQQYIDREIQFWARNTPIGVIFTIGTIIGFVVGVIICYQILANDIAEHMSEFATLKAMGYSDLYFLGLVIKQAVWLAIMGFLPGLLFSLVLFEVNTSITGLQMVLTPLRIGFVFAATVIMCVLSGMLALRKLLAADPASLF